MFAAYDRVGRTNLRDEFLTIRLRRFLTRVQQLLQEPRHRQFLEDFHQVVPNLGFADIELPRNDGVGNPLCHQADDGSLP